MKPDTTARRDIVDALATGDGTAEVTADSTTASTPGPRSGSVAWDRARSVWHSGHHGEWSPDEEGP